MVSSLVRTYRELRWQSWGLWLPIAVAVLGIAITVSAILKEPPAPVYMLDEAGKVFTPEPAEKAWSSTYVEWAHHFGPELIVLFLAAVFVEAHIARRERRNLLRQRLLEGLRHIVRFFEDHNGFFTGDSIMTLQNEREQLTHIWEHQAKGVRAILRDHEYRLFDEAISAMDQLLTPAQSSAPEADKWFMTGARLTSPTSQIRDGIGAVSGSC